MCGFMLKHLRNSICHNQGEIIQYFYLASYFHKQLKDGIRNHEKRDKIEEKFKNLSSFLNLKFAQICAKNFVFLQEYFCSTSRDSFRICLKSIYKGNVIDLYRNLHTPKDVSCSNGMDTGVVQIKKTGSFYINNNIPLSIFENKYTNPRLNIEKIRAYKEDNRGLDTQESLKKLTEEVWWGFWEDSKFFTSDVERAKGCYKSTLIIPLTVKNNALSALFLELTNVPNVDREIYAFLCMDSEKIDFFTDNDVNIGYIYADLLSLYLLASLNFTENSKTYKKALKLLNKQN